MHVTVLIVLMVALGLVATPLAIRSEGHIIGPTEHQAQADQVSVLKVEGMT